MEFPELSMWTFNALFQGPQKISLVIVYSVTINRTLVPTDGSKNVYMYIILTLISDDFVTWIMNTKIVFVLRDTLYTALCKENK